MGSGLAEQLIEFQRLVRHFEQLQRLVFQSRLLEVGRLELRRSCRFSLPQYRRNRQHAFRARLEYDYPPSAG